MGNLKYIAMLLAVTFTVCATSVRSHAQTITNFEGVDVVQGLYGSSICLGKMRGPQCSGPMVPSDAAAAIYARGINANLEQIRLALLELKTGTNDRLGQLADATNKTHRLMEQQFQQSNELLHETIVKLFDALPAKLLTDPLVKQEVQKLREDILKEVDRRIPKPPTP